MELALVYMLGEEMMDKRPTISFPQIVPYFFKPETINKLGDEVRITTLVLEAHFKMTQPKMT